MDTAFDRKLDKVLAEAIVPSDRIPDQLLAAAQLTMDGSWDFLMPPESSIASGCAILAGKDVKEDGDFYSAVVDWLWETDPVDNPQPSAAHGYLTMGDLYKPRNPGSYDSKTGSKDLKFSIRVYGRSSTITNYDTQLENSPLATLGLAHDKQVTPGWVVKFIKNAIDDSRGPDGDGGFDQSPKQPSPRQTVPAY